VNGKLVGTTNQPCDFTDTFDGEDKDLGNTGYIYAFPNVKFAPGKISALGKADGKMVARDEIETAGAPVKLKLTPHIGPGGLLADGSDAAFFDVEAVDARGRRCPTDEARVDFKLTGPAIWRGGYDSGITNSINNLFLDTECGINRVAVRSTLGPGVITLTAARAGLEPAEIQIESKPVKITGGLIETKP
jgi:beta-galactosidase